MKTHGKNGKQILKPKINREEKKLEPTTLCLDIKWDAKKAVNQLDVLEYMMVRSWKRWCVERCEQECTRHRKAKNEQKLATRLLSEKSSHFCWNIYILFAFLELRPHVDVVECGVFQLQAEFYSPFATFFMLFHGHWCYGGFDYLSERRRYSARSVCVLTPLNRITSCRASWLFVPLTRWKIHFPLVAMTIITKNFIFR